MIRPLFISPEFGTNDVNARIEELFLKKLSLDFSPTVLCKPNDSVDINKIEILQNEEIERFERKYHTYFFSPDTYHYSWGDLARKEICRRNLFNFDYIHTFSIPYASHLLGRDLKNKYKKPWVAQFFEPWYDNSYFCIKKNFVYRNAIKRWELQVAQKADIIIHNSDTMYQLWVEKYGKIVENKMFVQNMPFDPQLHKQVYANTTGKFVISHIGNLVGLRSCIPFVKAVSNLFVKKPKLREKLCINLVGRIQDSDLLFIKKENLLDVFNVVSSIPESECNQYYQMTDLFLVIEGAKQGGLFYPSKIIKYFYYQRPILGLTTEGSVLYKELTRTYNHCFENNEIDSISLFLENAIENYESICVNDISYWTNFDVRKIVKDYRKIIEHLI